MSNSKQILLKDKIYKYLKENFNKKNNLNRLFVFLSVAIIVTISFWPLWSWSVKQQLGSTPIGVNSFLYIYITTNDGISFSMLSDSGTWAVYLLQITMNIIIFIFFLFNKNIYCLVSLAFVFCGGWCNVVDRAIPKAIGGGEIQYNVVMDYLRFGFMEFAIFNLPDTYVVCGTIVFAAIYFTLNVKAILNESKKDKKEDNQEKQPTSKPKDKKKE